MAEGNKEHYAWIDRILLVDAPREFQKLRLIKRDNISSALADKILDAQATRAQRLAIATDVISNIHDLPSLQQSVQRLHKHYLQLAVLSGQN